MLQISRAVLLTAAIIILHLSLVTAAEARTIVFIDRASFTAACSNLKTINFNDLQSQSRSSEISADGVTYTSDRGVRAGEIVGRAGKSLFAYGYPEFVRLRTTLPNNVSAVGFELSEIENYSTITTPIVYTVTLSTGEQFNITRTRQFSFFGVVSDTAIGSLTIYGNDNAGSRYTGTLGLDDFSFGERSASSQAPTPRLLTEEGSTRAIAVDSVTLMHGPFTIRSERNFSGDRRTRISLFAANLSGEAAVGVEGVDPLNRRYQIPIEYVGQVPNFSGLTQIVVRLANELEGVGEIDIKNIAVGIYVVPTADFNRPPATEGSVVRPASYTFSDTTDYATSWLWTFHDGTTSTAKNPTKTYTVPGTYPVTLTATNGPYGSDTITKQVKVLALGEVYKRIDCGRLSGGTVDGFEQDNLFTENSATTRSTASVDLSGVSNPAPQSVYKTARIFTTWTPEYTFNTGNSGIVPSKRYKLRLHFNESNTALTIGQQVQFINVNGVAFQQTDDTFQQPHIDIRDRAGAANKAYIAEFIAPASASGVIKVDVRTFFGNSKICGIELLEAPPVASFTYSPTVGDQSLPRNFTDTSSGTPTAWRWNFGDGSATSTAQSPTHNFTAAGTYKVSLTATNALGISREFALLVTVTSAVAMAVSPAALPTGTALTPYTESLAAAGGTTGPFTFSVPPVIALDVLKPAFNSALLTPFEHIITEDDSLDITELDFGMDLVENIPMASGALIKKKGLPSGLSLSAGGVISGTAAAAAPSLVVTEGDSLTAGYIYGIEDWSTKTSPAAYLATMLGKEWTVANVARSGEVSARMSDQYISQVRPLYNPGYSKSVYVLSIGTNDLNQGVPLATTQANIQAVINLAKADGFLVVVATVSAAANFGNGINPLNNWMRTTMTGHDYLIDYGLVPQLSNGLDGAHFYNLGIHNTELGYKERAKAMKVAIDSLAANGNGTAAIEYVFYVKSTDANGNAATTRHTLLMKPSGLGVR